MRTKLNTTISTVRKNLLTVEYYSPYCGSVECSRTPRTSFNGEQFTCPSCGWVSSFENEFIKEYKLKWGLK